MQWRQRNAQNSVRNLLLFCLSRYRPRRPCLSSLITWYKNAGWDARQTKSRVCHSKCSFPLFRPYKGIQDSCEFWIPRRGFRIPGNGFRFFVSVTWILNCNSQWHSCSNKLYNEGIPKPRIPDSTSKNFLDYGFCKPKFPEFSNPDSLFMGRFVCLVPVLFARLSLALVYHVTVKDSLQYIMLQKFKCPKWSQGLLPKKMRGVGKDRVVKCPTGHQKKWMK